MLRMSGEKAFGLRPAHRHVNLRHQRKRVGLPGILHAYGPPSGLRRTKVDPRVGGRIAAFLVEDEVSGLEVDGILEFPGSALVRSGHARRIGFQIDLHFAVSRYVAGFLVVGKVVPVDLIEAGGITAVKNDADVVQFGASVQLELLELGWPGR